VSDPSPQSNLLKWLLLGCGAFVLLLLLSCVVLGIGGTIAYRVAYPPLPSDSKAALDIIDDQVAELRGLEFRQPVTFTLMTAAELRQNIEEDFAEDWSPDEARDGVITLAAFDLIDPDFDLYNHYLDLYSEQIAGYYDTEEKTLYVISNDDALNVTQRVTLAHELAHALQDQHFDLSQFENEGEDEAVDTEADFAFRALVEGEATLLEQQYLQHLAPHDFVRMAGEIAEIDTTVLDKTPLVIAEGQIFPYREGLTFAQNLYQQGGWAAVNEAYAEPPVSTEQILHPDRYRADDLPQVVSLPPLTGTLGSGWRQVDEDVFGEFYLRLHLNTHLSPTVTLPAAEGWGGDRYTVYHHPQADTVAAVLHTVWDTPADAIQFQAAYASYLTAQFGHPPDIKGAAQQCWQGNHDYRCLSWDTTAVTVIRGPDEAVVNRIGQAVNQN